MVQLLKSPSNPRLIQAAALAFGGAVFLAVANDVNQRSFFPAWIIWVLLGLSLGIARAQFLLPASHRGEAGTPVAQEATAPRRKHKP